MSDVLGWDIGGANLKVAHSRGDCRTVPFELWKKPHELAQALTKLAAEMPPAKLWAVTMTGELCDCFQTKREGVSTILDAVEMAAAGRTVRVWQTDGRFVDAAEAQSNHLKVAAANWHALATCAAQEFSPEGFGLLIDIGSTTTDLILLKDGEPAPTGLTDPERLISGELVYSGVGRTPVCAMVRELPYRGQLCPVAAELFATSLDVHLLTGEIPEQPENCGTADGRPATKACAATRMTRMVCADVELCSLDEAKEMARRAAKAQWDALVLARERVLGSFDAPLSVVVVSGSGEFLAHRLAGSIRPSRKIVSLGEVWGKEASAAACAWAMARLAGQQEG